MQLTIASILLPLVAAKDEAHVLREKMKKIKITRLPVFTTATLVSLFRAVSLVAGAVWQKAYFRTFFGPEARLTSDSALSPPLWLYTYVLPVVMAWVVTALVIAAFNAVAKLKGFGIIVQTDE